MQSIKKYLSKDSPQTAARLMKKFRKSTEKLKELGQNGYNFVNTHHSYRMLAEKLIKIIEE
jgi:arginyl-tRNA synthetase